MKDLKKYIKNDTFLYNYLIKQETEPTSQLADLWAALFTLISIVCDKDIFIDSKIIKSAMNLCFISNKFADYGSLLVESCNMVLDRGDIHTITTTQDIQQDKNRNKFAGYFFNLNDLEVKDLQKLRDHFILQQITERKKYDRTTYTMSASFCTNISDYTAILGTKTEKTNGLLSWTIPIIASHTKRSAPTETNGTIIDEYYSELIRFTDKFKQFAITFTGFQQYCKWRTHHVPKSGYYGSILNQIIEYYIPIVAACLAFNRYRYIIEDIDIQNAISILNITADEALEAFETETGINDKFVYGRVLNKIQKFLLNAGSNGMQHRSLYLKVHHDIDNDTFRYIMTVLHELNLVEKLKISTNSIIYRATEGLVDFDYTTVFNELKLTS